MHKIILCNNNSSGPKSFFARPKSKHNNALSFNHSKKRYIVSGPRSSLGGWRREGRGMPLFIQETRVSQISVDSKGEYSLI